MLNATEVQSSVLLLFDARQYNAIDAKQYNAAAAAALIDIFSYWHILVLTNAVSPEPPALALLMSPQSTPLSNPLYAFCGSKIHAMYDMAFSLPGSLHNNIVCAGYWK